MISGIDPDIIGIIQSCANTNISDGEFGINGYKMLRKDRVGQRGSSAILYFRRSIPVVQKDAYKNAGYSEYSGYIHSELISIVADHFQTFN